MRAERYVCLTRRENNRPPTLPISFRGEKKGVLGGLRCWRTVQMSPARHDEALRAPTHMAQQKLPCVTYTASSTARAGFPKIASGVLRMIDKSISQVRCSMYSKS